MEAITILRMENQMSKINANVRLFTINFNKTRKRSNWKVFEINALNF